MKVTLQIKNKKLTMTGMTTKKSLVLFLMLCTASIAFSQNDDFGIWYSVSAEKKLIKKVELDLDANVRTYNNASKIDEAFFDIGLTYKFNKFLSAAASYRFTEFLEKDDSFHPRHKWFADLKGKLPLGNFDISARLRFQQRYKTYFKDENDKESSEVGRVKLKLSYNIPSFPVNPYISSELFFPMFTTTTRNIAKTRFMAGLDYNISKKHSIELEYMFQRDFLPHISDINVISVNYNVKF
jgi:opacity protein-like surface antigen